MVDSKHFPKDKGQITRLKITPELVMEAFRCAAREAVAENDRLGIVTHGAKNGKLIERHPPKPPVR